MQVWRGLQELKYLDRNNNMHIVVREGDSILPAPIMNLSAYCPTCKVVDSACKDSTHNHVPCVEFKAR